MKKAEKILRDKKIVQARQVEMEVELSQTKRGREKEFTIATLSS